AGRPERAPLRHGGARGPRARRAAAAESFVARHHPERQRAGPALRGARRDRRDAARLSPPLGAARALEGSARTHDLLDRAGGRGPGRRARHRFRGAGAGSGLGDAPQGRSHAARSGAARRGMARDVIGHRADLSGIGMTSARTRDRLVRRLEAQGIRSRAVLDRIRAVPRHLFVDEALASRAYEDTALPIGLGQTISQPYVVARMTESLLDGFAPERVLEIGTGCGYQTAVLAPLVGRIHTV